MSAIPNTVIGVILLYLMGTHVASSFLTLIESGSVKSFNDCLVIGLPVMMPEGAFYIYPYIGGFGLSSEEFCQRLLMEEKCAIVPGTAFGECGEGYARISYAYSVKHIAEALEKIKSFVDKLK